MLYFARKNIRSGASSLLLTNRSVSSSCHFQLFVGYQSTIINFVTKGNVQICFFFTICATSVTLPWGRISTTSACARQEGVQGSGLRHCICIVVRNLNIFFKFQQQQFDKLESQCHEEQDSNNSKSWFFPFFCLFRMLHVHI